MSLPVDEDELVVDGTGANIKDVWDGNQEEEIVNITKFIEDYPILAMDTEFPGFCVK